MDTTALEDSALSDLGGAAPTQRPELAEMGPEPAEHGRRFKQLMAPRTATVFASDSTMIWPNTSVTIKGVTYRGPENSPAEGRQLWNFFAFDDHALVFSIGLSTTHSLLSEPDHRTILCDVATIVARLDEQAVRYLHRDVAQIELAHRAIKLWSPHDPTLQSSFEDLIAGPMGMTSLTRTFGSLALLNKSRICKGNALGSPRTSLELTDYLERLIIFADCVRDYPAPQAPVRSPVSVASPIDPPPRKSWLKHSHISQEDVEQGLALTSKKAKLELSEESKLAWLFNTELLDEGNILSRAVLDPLLSTIRVQYPNSEKKAVKSLLKGTTLDKTNIEKIFTGVYGDPAPDILTLHGALQIFRAVSHMSEMSFHGPWAGLHNIIPAIEQSLRDINPEIVALHEKRFILEVALPHAIQVNCEYNACMLSKRPMMLSAGTLSLRYEEDLKMLVVGLKTMVPMLEEALVRRHPKEENYVERGQGTTGMVFLDSPYPGGGKGKGKGAGVGQAICRDFARGACSRGDFCRYQHAGTAPPPAAWATALPWAPSPPWTPQAAAPPTPTAGWPQSLAIHPPTTPAGWPPAEGKGGKGRGVCYQFFQGRCNRGDACSFAHIPPQQLAFPPGPPTPVPASPAGPAV